MPRRSSPRLSRRFFLAAAAALAARPVFSPALAATSPPSGPLDVVIIGAGAAGIAAARKIAAAGRRYLVIEATDHVGGRCVTDVKSLGVPFDRGAHWIYLPDVNPVTRLAQRRSVDVYPAPRSQKVRIGRRFAREGELEDFLAAQVRATRAIDDAARKADIPSEQVMPNDLGDWRLDRRIRARPLRLRQGPDASVVVRFRAGRRAQHGGVLQAGFRHAAGDAGAGPRGTALDAGQHDRHAAASRWKRRGAASRHGPYRYRPDRRRCLRRISFTPDLGPADRRLQPAVARQLRPRCARTRRQSAGPRERRSGVREGRRYAHRRDPRQRLGYVALPDRTRRKLRPRTHHHGEAAMVDSPPTGCAAFTART